MVDLKTAVVALRSDANIWDKAAQDLQAPRQTIASLSLTEHDVSMYGADAGINGTYAQAQHAVEDLLRQAMENFHNLATSLRHAADLYDQTEADNTHRLHRAAGGH